MTKLKKKNIPDLNDLSGKYFTMKIFKMLNAEDTHKLLKTISLLVVATLIITLLPDERAF